MSFNGIGLQTPRGSGTSGHVQKNVALGKSVGAREKRQREIADEHRREARAKMAEARLRAGADVRSHDEKRYIEVKCMELRERLEDEDVDDTEIDKRVKNLREELAQKHSERKKEVHRDDRRGESKRTERTERIETLRMSESVRDRRSVNSVRNRLRSPDRLEAGKGEPKDNSLEVLSGATPKEPAYGYVPRYSGR